MKHVHIVVVALLISALSKDLEGQRYIAIFLSTVECDLTRVHINYIQKDNWK